eukprot:TRINITY_DN2359_c0_g5_i3.p1 TRINITY_DN2359_c0_g5~~TRINITY_DN2359_c0_g5_i3.p1  ORF type:complete len:122 (+),score=21.18 TRINITY_DN2359_c0_g5_i3:73-438(+)
MCIRDRSSYRTRISIAQAVIFVVDAAAWSRFDSARKELEFILSMPELSNAPVVVIGNKTDRNGAASEDELRESLGLPCESIWGKDTNKKAGMGRPMKIFMCSLAKRTGYIEALQWISAFLS